MRNDIGEAYVRVMRKSWDPASKKNLSDRDLQFRSLTEHTATMYIKAMIREWTKLGYQMPDAKQYLKGVKFVEAYQGKYAQRRSKAYTIALTNWYDLNHELSHQMFWRFSNATRRSGRIRHHHCDRHLEWERTGAEWICRRMIQDKPFSLS